MSVGENSAQIVGPANSETAASYRFNDDLWELTKLMRAAVCHAAVLDDSLRGGTGYYYDRNAIGPLFFEMCLTHAVDSAVTYIGDVLHTIYKAYPGALPSGDKVDVSYILQFTSVEDLTEALIERKVHQLAYQRLTDLDDFLKKNFGISMFVTDQQKLRAVALVDFRNLVVHNRGVVNRLYNQRQPDTNYALGQRITFSQIEAVDATHDLFSWITELDTRLIAKFALPTQPRLLREPISPFPILPKLSDVENKG
jgi:hypothetical protein